MTKPASLSLHAAVAGGLLVTFQATAQVQQNLQPVAPTNSGSNSASISSSNCNLSAGQSFFARANNLTSAFEEQLRLHLQTNLASCQNNVLWLLWAGQTLMKAKQHLLASDYLERALMLEPDNKGARLDYALALAGSDQPDAALSLVQVLMQESSMPDHLRASINGLLAKLEASQNAITNAVSAKKVDGQNASPHKFYAGAKLGRDSNLLGAPNLSELSLNFSGTPFSLTLDNSYLSQSGNYTRADLGWSFNQPIAAANPENTGLLQAWVQARGRESSVAPEARQQQVLVGVEYRARPFVSFSAIEISGLSGILGSLSSNQLGTYVSAQGVEIRGGTSVKYAAQTLGLGLHKASAPWGAKCEAKLGAEWQRRGLASNPMLSGRYQGLAAQWFCQNEQGQTLLVAASGGRDSNTDPARAGGAQSEAAARVMGRWGAVLVELEADFKKDSSVYSVLLSDGVRKIARAGSRIEWQGSLAAFPHVQVQAGAQWSHQRSNLLLFRQQNWGPYFGLSRAW